MSKGLFIILIFWKYLLTESYHNVKITNCLKISKILHLFLRIHRQYNISYYSQYFIYNNKCNDYWTMVNVLLLLKCQKIIQIKHFLDLPTKL